MIEYLGKIETGSQMFVQCAPGSPAQQHEAFPLPVLVPEEIKL